MALNWLLVNKWTYIYWLLSSAFSVSILVSAILFYVFYANTFDLDLDIVDVVFASKSLAASGTVVAHFYVLPVARFGNPTRCYYSTLQIQINRYFANYQQTFVSLVTVCTIHLCLFFVGEVAFIYHLYLHYYFVPSLLCELFQLCGLCYILAYRFKKGSNFFYQVHDWTYFLLDWTPLRKPLAALQPSVLLPRYQNTYNACLLFARFFPWNAFKGLLHFIELFLFFIFNVFLWLLLIVTFIVLALKIYVIGWVCCTERTRRIRLDIKRYGSFFDYALFDTLFALNFDTAVATLLEVEPTKYYLTHLAIIFFQTRYSQFVGCSIPDYNLEHDYICYETLYNFGQNTYSRILPSANDEYVQSLPPAQQVAQLFVRKEGQFKVEDELNLSLLFACYVRWFTHQFCNTNPCKPKSTNSPIGLNLCTLYGSTKQWEHKTRSFKNGLLKTTIIHGKEFPLTNEHRFFFSETLPQPKHHDNDFFCIQILFFRHHQYIARSLKQAYPDFDDERLFQTAKLCNILTCIRCTLALYGEMGLVQTNLSAKFDVTDMENIYNTWMYRMFGPTRQVFPQNSANVFVEFNIMYRWHQLIPPQIEFVSSRGILIGSEDDDVNQVDADDPPPRINPKGFATRSASASMESRVSGADSPEFSSQRSPEFSSQRTSGFMQYGRPFSLKLRVYKPEAPTSNHECGCDDEKHDDDDDDVGVQILKLPFLSSTRCLLMRKHGLERFLLSASNTGAGKMTLFNTDPFLCKVAVLPTIEKTRLYKLRSFNDYRERFGFERYSSFEELTEDAEVLESLRKLYRSVDDVEFYVGLFAEIKLGKALHGTTVTALFASFVMSFVTSSLLFRKPWKEMLTPLGKQIVNNTHHVKDLIRLHTDLKMTEFSFRVDG